MDLQLPNSKSKTHRSVLKFDKDVSTPLQVVRSRGLSGGQKFGSKFTVDASNCLKLDGIIGRQTIQNDGDFLVVLFGENVV